VTANNDVYIKGDLYVLGTTYNSAPGSTGTSPTHSKPAFSNSYSSGSVSNKLAATEPMTVVTAESASNITVNSEPASNITVNSEQVSINATKITANETKIVANETDVKELKATTAQHTTTLASHTEAFASHTEAFDSLSSSFNIYQQQTDGQFMRMRSEYSSGIATAIAISQINISTDGLSAGVGYGSFKGTGEVAIGIGYGGKLKNGTRFQLSAGKNGSATGAGFSMQFGGGD